MYHCVFVLVFFESLNGRKFFIFVRKLEKKNHSLSPPDSVFFVTDFEILTEPYYFTHRNTHGSSMRTGCFLFLFQNPFNDIYFHLWYNTGEKILLVFLSKENKRQEQLNEVYLRAKLGESLDLWLSSRLYLF